MKRFKMTALVMAMLLIVTALTGCTKEELSFLLAMEKMSSVQSYELSSNVTLDVDYTYNGDGVPEEINTFIVLADNFNLDIKQQYEGDIENNIVKSYIKADASIDSTKVSIDAWIDLDLDNENPKYQVILKLPALLKAYLPAEFNKEYISIDYMKFMDILLAQNGITEIDFQSYMREAGKTKEQLLDFYKIMKQTNSLKGDFIKASKTADGRDQLTLTLSDAQMKSFILSLLNEVKTNDALLSRLAEWSETYIQTLDMQLPEEWNQDAIKQLIVEAIDESLPDLEEYFANYPLLGEKGFVYELELDENGYVKNETMVININVDTSLLYYNMETLELTATIKNEYTNINKGEKINFPLLNQNNSAELATLFEELY